VSGGRGQAWRGDHAGRDHGGGEAVGKGVKAAQPLAAWRLALELGNDDSAMDQ
jgi:hypothetical protein